jgi:M6 family metalloprotease-like protein
MKKIIILLILMALCHLMTYAYYHNSFPVTVTQPDGAVVHCFTSGDEYYNWVHDADGYTLIRDEKSGYVVYAQLVNDELVSTSYIVGSVDPASLNLTPWTNVSAKTRTQLRSDFLSKIPSKPTKEGYQQPRNGQNNGTLNNIVVYVRFSDENEFAPKANNYNDMYNKDETGFASVFGYFKAASNSNTFIPSSFYPVPDGNIIISYQDTYPRSYFQPYNATTNPDGYQGGDNGNQRAAREHGLIKRAVEYIADMVDPSLDLDFNHDGLVDNICFMVKGSPGAWNSLLWPHRWALYLETVYIQGKQVWDFNLLLETHTDQYASSVLSHEMNHTLGAPDLYRYSDNTIDPVGSWDLMCANANPPQSVTAYVKYKYGGWIDNIPEITQDGTYTLHNIWSSTNNAYKIASPNSTTEFYVIEYRDQNVYWDSDLSGSGLIITRINTMAEGNASGPPDEVYVCRPGASNTTTNGSLSMAFFSSNVNRTEFHNGSNPPCFLSNDLPANIYIHNISESGGETMSFDVKIIEESTLITVDPISIEFDDTPIGKTTEPIVITVSSPEPLSDPITYYISGMYGDAFFFIEEDSWNPATGGKLKVTFKPRFAGTHFAKLNIGSIISNNESVSLRGKGIKVEAIEEQSVKAPVVTPNPSAGGMFLIQENQDFTFLRIFTADGRFIQEAAVKKNQLIDLHNYSSGLYLLQFENQTTGTSATVKVLVQ